LEVTAHALSDVGQFRLVSPGTGLLCVGPVAPGEEAQQSGRFIVLVANINNQMWIEVDLPDPALEEHVLHKIRERLVERYKQFDKAHWQPCQRCG
jgi:hypothetical protein